MRKMMKLSIGLICYTTLLTPLTTHASLFKITNDPNITLDLYATDELSGVAMKRFKLEPYNWMSWSIYDPQNTQTPTNILTDGGKEGYNDYTAVVKDYAENQSTTITRRVLLDLTGPVMTALNVSPIWTNKDTITVTASAIDNYEPAVTVGSISLSNDGLNFTPIRASNNSIDTTWKVPLIDGTRTLYANATDTAGSGNTGNAISINYMVDTVRPMGGIMIENGGEFIPSTSTTLTFNVQDLKTVEDNKSGVKTVRIFDKYGPYDYTLDFDADASLQEDRDISIPWTLATTVDPDGMEIGQVGIEITDRAGNSRIAYSQEVIVSQIVITDLCITEVINPRDFNSGNPFNEVCYNNLTGVGFNPIPMLMGGSFKFDIRYTYPALVNPSWAVVFDAKLDYIDGNFKISRQHYQGDLLVNGVVTQQEVIPYPTEFPNTSIRNGMEIYFASTLEIYDALGRKVGFDFLPRPQGASLKIGYIDGDIREYLMFNEIN